MNEKRKRVTCPTCGRSHAEHDPTYGPRLRTLRKFQRLTLREVAARADCSIGMVSDIEQSRRWPSPDLEDRILEALVPE